jgi:hypothetical protein
VTHELSRKQEKNGVIDSKTMESNRIQDLLNELRISKILPVLFGGAAVLGLIIYLLLGRSD